MKIVKKNLKKKKKVTSNSDNAARQRFEVKGKYFEVLCNFKYYYSFR